MSWTFVVTMALIEGLVLAWIVLPPADRAAWPAGRKPNHRRTRPACGRRTFLNLWHVLSGVLEL